MNLADAVIELRQQMDLTQPAFAEALGGFGMRSLCRWEKGAQPNSKALKALAALAKRRNVPHLQKIFEALYEGEMASRVSGVTGNGQRTRIRIKLETISRWARVQSQIAEGLEALLEDKMSPQHRESLRVVVDMLKAVNAELVPYLTGPDLEQDRLSKQLAAELMKRVTPGGRVDLEGISLGPLVQGVSYSPEGGFVFQLHKDENRDDLVAFKAAGEQLRKGLPVKPRKKRKG